MKTARSWGVVVLLLAACDGTLPPAPPHASVAPSAPSTAIDVCWLEYARDTLPGSYGIAGASERFAWTITFSGVLVRHPRGDVLLDVGNSTHFAAERATSRFVPNLLQKVFQSGGTIVASVPQALRGVGESPAALAAIALSHAHADHAGGVMDLPGTPILVSAEERAFAEHEKELGDFAIVRAQAAAITARSKPVVFTPTPYENFDASLDLYGDGSIVFVPLFGHTPGSMGTFVNRSPKERYFHVGDAVDTVEALERRRGKSVVLAITDEDGARADAIVAKLDQLHAQDPALHILPAHDRDAWRGAFGAPGRCRSQLAH